MSVTALGAITIAAVLCAWVFWRPGVGIVLALTVPFPQTAALIVAGRGFPLFYVAAAIAIALSAPLVLARAAGAGRGAVRPWSSVDTAAVALWSWCCVITFLGPRLFAGLLVFDPRLGIDDQVGRMAPLVFSSANVSQLVYLTLGVLMLLLAGRTITFGPRGVELALGATLALALARYAFADAWPTALLQNLPGPLGIYSTFDPRLAGTFSEPSMLGLHLVAAAAYFAHRLSSSRRSGLLGAWLALAATGFEVALNRSGTAIGGLAVIAAVALLLWVVRVIVAGRVVVRSGAVAVGTALLAVGLTQVPLLRDTFVGTVLGKDGTSSMSHRAASNGRSVEIFTETFGIGVGLGSHRPSSLFFSLLAGIGVVGLLLFAVLVAAVVRGSSAGSRGRSTSWALVGALAAAVVAVPDLSLPVLWFLMASTANATAPPRTSIAHLVTQEEHV